MRFGAGVSARAAAQQAASQINANAVSNAFINQQQAFASLLEIGAQKASSVPARVNRLGQTQRQWLDGLKARTAMMEISGFPMSVKETTAWEAEALEWRNMR